MSIEDLILAKLQKLNQSRQNVVLEFIDFLNTKNYEVQILDEDQELSKMSLSNAMKGMEDEELIYTAKDIKIKY